jgi:hypothetical protein
MLNQRNVYKYIRVKIRMEKKKVFGLVLLGLFLIPLLVQIAIAATPGDLFRDLLTTIANPDLDVAMKVGISRILLVALVAMLVYSVVDYLPFVSTGNTGLKWGIAIVIAVLSFLFVPMEDLQLLLVNYEALGIALTSIVPLIILMIFSVRFEIEMRTKTPGMMFYVKLINKLLFVLFGVYLLIKSLQFYDTWLFWIYVISLAVIGFWWWKGKHMFMTGSFVEGLEEGMRAAEMANLADLEGEILRLEETYKNLPSGRKQNYQRTFLRQKIDGLRDLLKEKEKQFKTGRRFRGP